MEKMSLYMFMAAFATLALATGLYLGYLATRSRDAATYGQIFGWMGCAFLGLSLVFRTVAAGRVPFVNMYEYSVGLGWGIALAAMVTTQRRRIPALGGLVLPLAVAFFWYASTVPSEIEPLGPALQTNLLPLHVSFGIAATGAFAVAFAAALMYLIQAPNGSVRLLPSRKVLDEIGHKAVLVGFPLFALMILVGAYWAYNAWTRYWGWDPKEVASLVTCMVYASYLHARGVRGWRGARSAALLIVGFGATLFTFFGVNLLIPGLHSYAGV